ncbi:MAG: hypothetical protein EB128_08805 [Betaproteobacteria bacterium]|nr:hypothetical protein [Betaproteobacteria bacterium]
MWNHAVNTYTLECAVKILIYLFFGLGQFLIPTAGANDSHDTKNMCLANVMAQQSYCYSIKSHDMKQQCLAQVK